MLSLMLMVKARVRGWRRNDVEWWVWRYQYARMDMHIMHITHMAEFALHSHCTHIAFSLAAMEYYYS
jgi:hypothetical protein